MNNKQRILREFHYKDAHFHIHTDRWDDVCSSIIAERENLEAFIREEPDFQRTLRSISLTTAPDLQIESVRRMQDASVLTGLGPMAAVAGTMAQLAAEYSRKSGSAESIVENGGDLFLDCRNDVVLGLYTGQNRSFENLAFRIPPAMMPLGVCTSSSRMGHSLSFGDCDLVTVFSKNASLADAAATLGCNSVKTEKDIEPVLEKLYSIEGISAVLIIRDDKLGAIGDIPELIRSVDTDLEAKVSRDEFSSFK